MTDPNEKKGPKGLLKAFAPKGVLKRNKSNPQGDGSSSSTNLDKMSDKERDQLMNPNYSQVGVKEHVRDEVVLYSMNFQVHIKGGTKVALVERLAHKATAETDILVFLLGYRDLLTPKELLSALFTRYDSTSQPLSVADPKDWEQMLKSIRIKIAKILRLWLQHHFTDFASDQVLLNDLGAHVKRTYGSSPEFTYLANEIIELVNVQQKEYQNEPVWVRSNMMVSPPILPESSRFEDFSPKEIARQLSLYILSLIRSVVPVEFFNFTWYKSQKAVPHVKDLLLFCVDLSDWVATRILEAKDVRDRIFV